MFQAGKYDQKVTFRSYQDITDNYGGSLPVWSDVLTTFAAVTVNRAFNVTEASQLELPLTYDIRVQYRSSFSPDESMRINYLDKDLMIKSVRLNMERQKREWIITATTID